MCLYTPRMQREDLETLRTAWPISAVLAHFGLPTGQNGRSRCPLCDSVQEHRSDNFSFTEDEWHCFRCGKGGDTFDLVQELANTDFSGALKVLSQRSPNTEIRAHAVSCLAGRGPRRNIIQMELEQWHTLSRLIEHERDARMAQLSALEDLGKLDPEEATLEKSYADELAVRAWNDLDLASTEIVFHLRRNYA